MFCLRGRSAQAVQRLLAVPAADVLVPLQVHAELLVGAAKSADPTRSSAIVLAFLAPFRIAWPTSRVEDEYVQIRCALEKRGMAISEADLWIAATVRSEGATLITNNTSEFSRVANLTIADWTAP